MVRTLIKELFSSTPSLNEKILVKGWVRTRRGNKNVSFIALNDGSTIRNLQIVITQDKFSAELISSITTGSSIGVIGTLVASQGAGQTIELQAEEVTVYGTCDPNQYPLQKRTLA